MFQRRCSAHGDGQARSRYFLLQSLLNASCKMACVCTNDMGFVVSNFVAEPHPRLTSVLSGTARDSTKILSNTTTVYSTDVPTILIVLPLRTDCSKSSCPRSLQCLRFAWRTLVMATKAARSSLRVDTKKNNNKPHKKNQKKEGAHM